MRKLVSIIVTIILMISMLTTTTSYASTNVELALSSTSQKLYAEDTVVFTLKLDNMQEIKHGINAIQAKLEYNKDIFEEVKEINFKPLNGWEGVQYNQSNNEFVIYKKAGTTLKEDVVEISLKVRKNIKANVTNVEVTNMILSEGKEDIEILESDKTVSRIDIIEKQDPGDNNKPGDNKPGDNNPGNNNPGGNSQDNKPNNKPNADDNLVQNKLPKTGKSYIGLFFLLVLEIVVSVNAVYFGRKFFKSKKQKMTIIIPLTTILLVQFVGTVYGAVSYFSKKGDLNGDGAVNYADVNLLVSHLIKIKSLEEGKSEEDADIVKQNADINNDGKITVTDLSLLIQKIENKLDYEVTMSQINVSNYYPAKNEEITLSFEAEANYEGIIKNITMNGNKYELVRNEVNQNLYEIKVNVGATSGVKEYKFEKATLTNEKTVDLNSSVKVDVLKSIPEITNWKQSEDVEKHELNLSFDVKDEDNAFLSGSYRIIEKTEDTEEIEEITDEEECIKTGEFVAGSNTINVKVEEEKTYQIIMCMEYNLDTDTLEQEQDNRTTKTTYEELKLIVDYDFKMSNVETYKYKNEQEEKTIEFGAGEYITLKFNSTNKTTCVPKQAIVNGKTYELSQKENTYTAVVEGFENAGEHKIAIEKVILSNGKEFDVSNIDGNEEITIKVIKNAPTIARFRANEDRTMRNIDARIYVKDTNKAITDLIIKIYDDENNEVASKNLTQYLIEQNIVKESKEHEDTEEDNNSDKEIINTYYINTHIDVSNVDMVNKYKAKIFANYSLVENDENYTHNDEVILDESIEATPVAHIQNVETSKKYFEKNERVTINYEIETNKKDLEITHIIVNNVQCIATRNDHSDENVTYSITLPVGEKSGILNLHATEFIFEGNIEAKVDNNVRIDVLKDKPTSEAFSQSDNIENRSVTLTANIVDPDKAFIEGSAVLVRNSDGVQINEKQFDSENITFTINNIELDTKYTLIAKMTYDRDSNELEETNQNFVEDEIFRRRPIQLIADYELKISDLQTYKQDKQTIYFERGDEVTVSFNSTNKSDFYPVKAIINVKDNDKKEYEKEYDIEKQGNNYKAKIPVVSTPGPKTITIKQLILNNTKQLEVVENNEARVGVLKLRPTITDFGYEDDDENKSIHVAFTVNDSEETITGGKIIVLDENEDIIKEEEFNRNSNGITFTKGIGEEYEVRILADYDLDSNQITTGDNEYKEQKILSEVINVSTKRLFEVKDIVGISVYKSGSEKEVTNISEADLNNKENLKNYIVNVRTKGMPTFSAEIEDYEIVDNKLNFILDYENVIQYENGKKQNKLKVTYGEMKDGVAQNKSIETLIAEIEEDPSKTVTLTQNYDASYLKTTGNAIINTTFRGTLDGNGYKIIGLKKPLFENTENATIKNLVLENVKLIGASSRGSIANLAQNTTITNVHIKGINMTTGINESGGMVGELQSGCQVSNSSVTGMHIKLDHIRIGSIAGKITGTTISNCYAEGIIESITSSRDGVGGIAGDSFEAATSTIENCIAKINFVNNARLKNNGGILGLARGNNTILRNNISLDTGTGPYKVFGTTVHKDSINNYELEESELISNASGNIVKKIGMAGITKEFYISEAKFSEDIWNLDDVSYDKLPHLKNDDPNNGQETVEQVNNNDLYIPEYDRISKISGFDTNKLLAYHNLQKLMPYYDAKYLISDGATISSTDILNTKAIKHILPFTDNKLVTYLTSEEYNQITNIKIVFEDNTIENREVTFEEIKQSVAIYKIKDTKLSYAFGKYVVQEQSSIVNTLTEYIENLDYTVTLDPITTAADNRLYKDHYNEVIKANAQEIALKLLQNYEVCSLTIDNDILNEKIQKDLIEIGKVNKVLYGYNYFDRWYGFEIGGAKVSDIIFFEGKMYKDSMTIDNLAEEVAKGNIGVNATNTFYANNIKKYTESANIGQFIDNIITNIGGYEEEDDWFTEYFGSRNVLAEVAVDDRPDILYRGWYQLKKNERMILPVITLPSNCAYMISGPAHLQFGAQQLYHKDPHTDAGRKDIVNKVNNHVSLVKRHFSTLAASFDSGKWNRYCIMIYDCTKAITGFKTIYFPGTNIPIKTGPVYTQGKVGTQQPFFKNFSEVLGLWQPGGSSAGVGNTAGFLWFQATPGLDNYDTWTHEYEHALYDKIMLHQRGCRVQLETLTEGNIEQRVNWSENNLVQDVGPYYFNTSFYLNKEGNATQNLTPERINTKEKLENYFKGQQNALDLLDYIEGKAFIKLTPEQQAKIATRMSISAGWSSWGTITAQQATDMKLTSLEALYDNRILLRPSNAWGVSVRGLNVINGIGTNDYGFESVWVNRWFIGHLDGGYADAFSTKRNFFEMLGYAGVEGYVTYGSKASANDLDAIKKITKMVTGTEMDWKQYKMSRYATVEENINNNKYIDVESMIERYTEALINDATNGDRNISQRTNLRKIYYHYLKSATNDFIADPLGTDIEITHIKTAQELVEKINSKPYGYYVLDNDIDFTGYTGIVSQTFMGKLDGNGHKIIGNTNSIFQKIRYGYVSNLDFEGTAISKDITNIGVLAKQTQSSILENINVTDLSINAAGRNNISLIGGAVSAVTYKNCQVEQKTYQIGSVEDFNKLEEDPSGIFNITKDLDFTGYTAEGSAVVTSVFTGKIEGNGHTISNLNNLSLFANFRGTVQNLNIKNFTNTGAGRGNGDFVAAYAQETFTANFKNMKFENITLSGRNNVAVVTGMDGRENANSVFENISVKNANVTGTGVYVSTFAGRKYGGKMQNIYVQGTLNVTGTENGGLVGSMQQGGTIENIIADVNIIKTSNSYSNVANSVFNAPIVGNIYNTPAIKNSVAFGDMTGYDDTNGNKMLPYKCVGAIESQVIACLTKCYEITECVGASRVSDKTAGHLDKTSRSSLNTEFYKNLGFDETIWNFNTINSKGYPELK
ncbi:MAG: hypothetical protein HFJ55_06630 [Clostridia bacterium]|nr:hypothetical protein [Clostridia bacterium]